MILVLGCVTIQAGNVAAALALSQEHVGRSRAEPGCIAHGVYTDPADAERLMFVEKWADTAALQAHFRVPESRAFAKALASMATKPPTLEVFDASTVSLT